MLRISLIAYLMVGTLTGPAWCCCTLDRLTAWLTPAKIANGQAKSRGCCHQQGPAQDESESRNSTGRTTPAPRESPCPCKEHGSNEMAAVPSTIQETRDSRWLTDEFNHANPLFMPIGWVSPALAQSDDSLPGASDGACLTGRQILCAFQVFRC